MAAKEERIEKKNDKPLLMSLQGNILKGHDRNYAALFLLQFIGPPEKVKARIEYFANEGYVTSAYIQLEEWELYHKHKIPGGSFANFFLTAAGYRALDLPLNGFEEHFINGMQAYTDLLGDRVEPAGMHKGATSTPENWDNVFKNPRNIHAMLLIADDEESNLGQKVRMVLRDVLRDDAGTPVAEIIGYQYAHQLRDGSGQPIEHFGFRDGISNPTFLAADEDDVLKYGGSSRWKSWASPKIVLVKDPLGGDDEQAAGSYLVYRKLEQHVRLFETMIRNFAQDGLRIVDPSESDLERARAMIFGRFRDGTPLALRDTPYGPRYPRTNYNNFTYADDASGTKCPFHAHIRKVNPRDDEHPSPLIVRRGMTYGKRDFISEENNINALPNSDVGLLFMCFQSDIPTQYEYIQRRMVNNPDFPVKGTGIDPIAGVVTEDQPSPPQNWPLNWGQNTFSFTNALSGCVTVRGGEYFFAPSIKFLKNITRIDKTGKMKQQEGSLGQTTQTTTGKMKTLKEKN
ncbi:MAG: peroxidase [Nitrospira sp. WS238]|nr:peroxidase [Nitrospira sp. WS238]